MIHLPPGVLYLSVRDLLLLYHVLRMSSISIFVVDLSKILIIDLPTGAHSIEQSIVVSDAELPVVSDFEPPVVMSDTELPPLWLRKKMYLLTRQIIS